MLSLGDFKHTKVYQEAFQEGKVEGKSEAVPAMLALGASVEYIANALGLELEQVRHLAQNQSQGDLENKN